MNDVWPKNEDDLLSEIRAAMAGHEEWSGEDGYGRCPAAMARAALAAFRYVAHVLGVTGFQASRADLAFLRETRGLKGPFVARERIATDGHHAHPDVLRRWTEIAAAAPSPSRGDER